MKLFNSRVKTLFNIEYPIIQGGMVWCSGSKLAAAVSNAGGLGIIGVASMNMETLKIHLEKVKTLTSKPVAVNIPILYTKSSDQLKLAIDAGIRIFFTSAGSPKTYTQFLKDHGCTVVHVTSSPELALKCQDAGVDAVVAEGFEAGGHNGREEITTLSLIPQVREKIKIPLIAAGGIVSGRGILAALALGADGVQMGTRFLLSDESSAHPKFKELLLTANAGSTMLSIKQHIPVRLFKNKFFTEINKMENEGATIEELVNHLGKGRAKLGMFDGNLDEGELEVGQAVSLIKKVLPVKEIMSQLISEYKEAYKELST
ncbi:MAG: nitronate monooxygenase [Bacteriovoracaceae bacterium]